MSDTAVKEYFEIQIPSAYRRYAFAPLTNELLAEFDGGKGLKKIIKACCLDDLRISNLTKHDLEYIFLVLRAKSGSAVFHVCYRDGEDGKIYQFKIDLNDVKPTTPFLSLHYKNTLGSKRTIALNSLSDFLFLA